MFIELVEFKVFLRLLSDLAENILVRYRNEVVGNVIFCFIKTIATHHRLIFIIS
jgi:hypothetical protein